MPTPDTLRPIQRVPSGLPGPGGIGFRPFAHGESGGNHHGLRCFVTILNRPRGVGNEGCPTATPKRRHSTVFLCTTRYSLSWWLPREIAIAGGSFEVVTVARSFFSVAVASRPVGLCSSAV